MVPPLPSTDDCLAGTASVLRTVGARDRPRPPPSVHYGGSRDKPRLRGHDRVPRPGRGVDQGRDPHGQEEIADAEGVAHAAGKPHRDHVGEGRQARRRASKARVAERAGIGDLTHGGGTPYGAHRCGAHRHVAAVGDNDDGVEREPERRHPEGGAERRIAQGAGEGEGEGAGVERAADVGGEGRGAQGDR